MKMNIVNKKGRSQPECTKCGYRFNTDYATNPYLEMINIAHGKYKFCPECGDKYEGCQVDGIDFNKCSQSIKIWASPHNV